MQRNRLTHSILVITVVILGLASRLNIFPRWVHLYVGDALWALMMFFIVATIFNKKSIYWVMAVALFFVYSIEVSQLYQAPWINIIRNTRTGGLILGYGFLWSDIIAYTIGISIGFFLEKVRLIKKPMNKLDQIK